MAPLCGGGKIRGSAAKMVLCSLLFLIPMASSAVIPHRKLEVQKQLMRLNKPALKSIKVIALHLFASPIFSLSLSLSLAVLWRKQACVSSMNTIIGCLNFQFLSKNQTIRGLWFLHGCMYSISGYPIAGVNVCQITEISD